MYYLCEKYYKPITVQYYMLADYVSWVPRLTLLVGGMLMSFINIGNSGNN